MVTNQTLLKIIKVKLEGAWPKELPGVLWAYQATTRTHTRETPFKLVFGLEVVILVEVSLSSLKKEPFDEEANEESRSLDLDFLDVVKKDVL